MADFFNRFMDNLRGGPLGPVVRWAEDHPRLSMWIVLAVGMLIILIPESLKVEMEWYQRASMAIAVIITAALAVWIISWEDEDEAEGEAVVAKPAKAETQAETPAAKTPAKKGTGKLPAKKGTGRLAKKK